MRVQVHKSSDQAKPAPAEMSENGRTRRKRIPKLCDCCRSNSKLHPQAHSPVTKKRGRRKKEGPDPVELTTGKDDASAVVDKPPVPDTDPMTVSEEQRETPVDFIPTPSGEEHANPAVSDFTYLHNGAVLSQGTGSESNNADSTSLSVSKESNSDVHAGLGLLIDPSCLNSQCDEMSAEPVTRNCTADADAMEVEHASYSVYIHTKALRDHRYCKRLYSDTETERAEGPLLISAELQHEDLIELLYEYLELFYGKYGSFIPLSEEDILEHLTKHVNTDMSDKRKLISREVMKYKAGLACVPMNFFKVTYNKHTLALEDLSTLGDQNWVNDQVINMYGELIMDATNHRVHFFNSFFYRQLVAKGFEGVKRWTKKVDVFSKQLLLIPLHLEIHWSLITVEISKQNINFYDSQGILFKFAVENIVKYIIAEAKEKKHIAFQKGWKMTVNKGIPQQKNDNDCGVFVLEYCKCLAFKELLNFTQEDMPKVRKRIYKELCDCKLTDIQKQV